MLEVLANTFKIATGTDTVNEARQRRNGRAHWPPVEPFDMRRSAELDAHLIARRRD